MSKTSPNITDLFQQIVTPRVTAQGLRGFTAILDNENPNTKLFYHKNEGEWTQFLIALANTKGNQAQDLLVRALSKPNTVSKLVYYGQSKLVINALSGLSGDQITQILSADDAVVALLEKKEHKNFIFDTLNRLNDDQITQILSARYIVMQIARARYGDFVIDTLNRLNDDQATQILSADRAHNGLYMNGHEDALIEIEERLTAATQRLTTAPPPPSGMG